jgi:hypothetical protein
MIILTPALRLNVAQQLATGLYDSPTAVIEAALLRLPVLCCALPTPESEHSKKLPDSLQPNLSLASVRDWAESLRAYPENVRSLRPTMRQAANWTNPK